MTMETRMFDRYTEDPEAQVMTWFTHRNEGRGQHPKRFTPQRKLREMLADGTMIYTYTYKSEVCEMIIAAYTITVNFNAPTNTTWTM